MQTFRILSGALTPIIALIAIYIAFRQYRIAQYKLKYDLYEKRLQLFNEFKSVLLKTNQDWRINRNELRDFKFRTNECKFLFKRDIVDFRCSLIEKALKITQINEAIEARNSNPEKLKGIQTERNELSAWFIFHYENIEELFYKYLDFRKLGNVLKNSW